MLTNAASPRLARALDQKRPLEWPLPKGYSYVWVPEVLMALDGRPPRRTVEAPWHLLEPDDRPIRCRAGSAPGHKACGAPAAAARFTRAQVGGCRWWGYCEEHLAPRVVHLGGLWRREYTSGSHLVSSGRRVLRVVA